MKYALIALIGLLMVPAVSQAGGHSHWSIGVGFGWSSGGSYVSTSGYYGHGGYYGGGGYYGYAPRYYAPPPVVYRPAPVYYAPAPVYYAPAPSYYYAPRVYSTYYGGAYCR